MFNKDMGILLASITLGLSAPTATLAQAEAAAASDAEQPFAAAIAEAFERYEAEVDAIADLTYRSRAEAYAVARTVAEHRFDLHLQHALARRHRTVADLARYAHGHPAFARLQQERFDGRLARLRTILGSLEDRVLAAAEPDAALEPQATLHLAE